MSNNPLNNCDIPLVYSYCWEALDLKLRARCLRSWDGRFKIVSYWAVAECERVRDRSRLLFRRVKRETAKGEMVALSFKLTMTLDSSIFASLLEERSADGIFLSIFIYGAPMRVAA